MFGRGPRVGRGDVRAAILALLAEEPMHGYQIITELTDRSGGVWHPSPGSVYPTLQAMEDQGLVTADTSAGRRVFSLTDEGRAVAEAAGDGPAPWEDAARSADRSLVDLRGLMFEVGAAIMQVGRAGSDRQIKAVADILTDTRRRIYLVLADGRAATTPDTGHPTRPKTGRARRAPGLTPGEETPAGPTPIAATPALRSALVVETEVGRGHQGPERKALGGGHRLHRPTPVHHGHQQRRNGADLDDRTRRLEQRRPPGHGVLGDHHPVVGVEGAGDPAPAPVVLRLLAHAERLEHPAPGRRHPGGDEGHRVGAHGEPPDGVDVGGTTDRTPSATNNMPSGRHTVCFESMNQVLFRPDLRTNSPRLTECSNR